jgi:predicted ATPase
VPATTARPDPDPDAASVSPGPDTPGQGDLIRTPDQRVRVFASSTLEELADERRAVRAAVTQLRLVPVMFELGARPHPPRQVYRAYIAQSQVFVGIYWQRYGWVAPGEKVSGLEDEYLLSAGMPRLIYVKSPAPDREPRLAEMLARIKDDGRVSYRRFSGAAELQRLVENDLAVLLSERFEMARPDQNPAGPVPTGVAGAVPAPATPLVDREREAAAVEELVARDGARLITLTGPGGVGKSRLAVEIAGRLGPRFPDGVRFADLAAVRTADLVPAAIAGALGLSTSGGMLLADIMSYLRSRHLMLVLDNFEQVTGAAPLVAALLTAAPGLVTLVTSRMVLRLSGEHELLVPPLPVPPFSSVLRADHRDGRPAADLQRYASVRLFEARARAVAPGFELTSDNAEAVAEICRRLDGLPLAIELAAARTRMLPPQALLARLDDRLGTLTGGPLDLPERQRTLRNTLDWSFGLLSAAEQALFARLGVFAGTFGLPSVAAVCGDPGATTGDQAAPPVDILTSLVDSSLVRAESRDGEPRFSLLETIREYALDRLRDSGDWTAVHDRHAAYFLALAEPADAELHGAGQLAWLDRLETRHDNLSAALTWLVDTDQIGPAVRLVWATWRFWWLHGHAEELTRHADRILADSDRLPPATRALALSGAGFAHFAGGDQARARRLLKQSLPLYRQTGNRLGMGLTAAALGHLLAAQHDEGFAADLLEQTLVQLRAMAGDPLTAPERVTYLLDVALASNFLGQIRLGLGDHQRAAELFTDGLAAAHGASDRFTILVSLYDLALSRQARGDLPEAASLLTEGLSLAAEAGDEPSVAYYLEALADVAARKDDPRRAAALLAAAHAMLEANGSGWLHAYVPRVPHDAAALRARLPDAAFDQAWDRGCSLASTADPRALLDALDEDVRPTARPVRSGPARRAGTRPRPGSSSPARSRCTRRRRTPEPGEHVPFSVALNRAQGS